MAENKRNKIARRVYLDAEGTEYHRLTEPEKVVAARVDFYGDERDSDGNQTVVDTRKVDLKDLNAAIQTACAWHGFMDRLIGEAGAHKQRDEAPIDLFDAMLERLAGGEWVKEGEGAGQRPSMLLEAVIAFLTGKGEEVGDERKAAIAEKLKTDEGKKMAGHPQIQAIYTKMAAERAAERAAKAAEKAAKSDDEDTGEDILTAFAA